MEEFQTWDDGPRNIRLQSTEGLMPLHSSYLSTFVCYRLEPCTLSYHTLFHTTRIRMCFLFIGVSYVC